MIVIIDYKTGNLGSIKNMLKKFGESSVITSDSNEIEKADKLILPGVGAFDQGMGYLRELGLIEILRKKVQMEKTPILGICLGMQLMSNSSEEGKENGLGWVDAKTIKFKFHSDVRLPIPNMGWNSIEIKKEHYLMKDIGAESRFYFVHSYHVVCNNEQDLLATSNYGITFNSAFAKDNVMGTQFHPEKSLKYGMNVLRNFATYRG